MHEEIEPSRREVGDLETGGPDHAKACARRVQRREARILLSCLAEAQARYGERLGQTGHAGYMDGLAVQRRTRALRGHERLPGSRRMHRSRARLAAFDVTDEHAVEGKAAAEVKRAVDRVDDPKALGSGQSLAGALLRENRDARVVCRKPREDRALGRVIRGGREVGAPAFARDDRGVADGDRVADRDRGLGGKPRKLREAGAVARASLCLRHRSGRVPGRGPTDR